MRVVTTADGSRTLYSDPYEQTMHSHRGAVTESRHVFLEGAGVAARLGRGEEARVLEVGFGTGLNFFLTADLALKTDAPLEYVALERALLPSQVVRQLGYESPLEHKNLLQEFFKARDSSRGANAVYMDAFSAPIPWNMWRSSAPFSPPRL